jgi:hypothetical protein
VAADVPVAVIEADAMVLRKWARPEKSAAGFHYFRVRQALYTF